MFEYSNFAAPPQCILIDLVLRPKETTVNLSRRSSMIDDVGKVNCSMDLMRRATSFVILSLCLSTRFLECLLDAPPIDLAFRPQFKDDYFEFNTITKRP